jgi:ketopantoate reductase
MCLLVVGAGSTGAYFGGKLAEAGSGARQIGGAPLIRSHQEAGA